MVSSFCYWEINKIVLDVDKSKMILFELPKINKNSDITEFGTISKGQIDLSIEEAKQLIKDLQKSIKEYENLEKEMNK